MESTGKRVSAFLLELEEELAVKDRDIAGLEAQLAARAAEVPSGLRELIGQQEAQLKHSRDILRALEIQAPFPAVSLLSSEEDTRQLRTGLDEEREAHGQQIAKLSRELDAYRESGRQAMQAVEESSQLRAQLESERASHQQHIALLISELEAARESFDVNEEVCELRRQLEFEREEHQQAVSKLAEALEAARESESALETALLAQRGAMQRIEAKFNLYAAAVSKLAGPAEVKRPKLLQPLKQLSQRKP